MSKLRMQFKLELGQGYALDENRGKTWTKST